MKFLFLTWRFPNSKFFRALELFKNHFNLHWASQQVTIALLFVSPVVLDWIVCQLIMSIPMKHWVASLSWPVRTTTHIFMWDCANQLSASPGFVHCWLPFPIWLPFLNLSNWSTKINCSHVNPWSSLHIVHCWDCRTQQSDSLIHCIENCEHYPLNC